MSFDDPYADAFWRPKSRREIAENELARATVVGKRIDPLPSTPAQERDRVDMQKRHDEHFGISGPVSPILARKLGIIWSVGDPDADHGDMGQSHDQPENDQNDYERER